MLPSRGFFKKNDCPFFEKGLCVRPHCHFRHKKKIENDETTSIDVIDVLSKPTYSVSVSPDDILQSTSSTSTEKSQSSKKEETAHDSLFAKLVNEANPYEKINRHIPCAYTPTPTTRLVQPKNKSKDSNGCINSAKSLEIINKARTHLQNSSIKSVSNQVNNKTEEKNVGSGVSDQNNKYLNYESNSYVPKEAEYKIKGGKSNEDGSKEDCYVPSKKTLGETKYVPEGSDNSSSNQYVPSKEKNKKKIQYVPESSGNVSDEVSYTPSGKGETGETGYQPEGNNCANDYVPTEKAVTNNSDIIDGERKSDLADLEFISSEIEMMKELLKEDGILPDDESKNIVIEKKSKDEKKSEDKKKSSKSSDHHKSHSSRHKSSSKHKSESSSHRHSSSSSSRHDKSRSSSSKHSSRHSSFSKHHSSSSKKSDRHHRRKSSDDKKHEHKKSDSHKSSRHKSKKENGKDRRKDKESESEEDYDNLGNNFSGSDNETYSENSDDNCDSKKRKKEESDNERNVKARLSLSDDEVNTLFDEIDDDPDLVEKECLEIFNNYSETSEADTPKTEITVSNEEFESSVQAKKRKAHSANLTSDHTVLREKTFKKANKIKSAQEVLQERYKTVEKNIEKPKESAVSSPAPVPILGLSRPPIRIAAVSNIQQMLLAKKKIQEKINQGLKVNERTTIAQTVAHGSTRKAHVPVAVQELKEKPTIKDGTKQVSRIKRQAYLEKLLIETNKIYPTKSEAAEEALKLEEEVFRAHSGSLPAYQAAFTSLLVKMRRRVAALQGDTTVVNTNKLKVSHFDVLSGGKKNFSVIKTRKVDISMLTDKHIYEELLRCKLTPEELKENGFPVDSGRPGYATCSLNFELKYNDKYQYIKKMSRNMRYCIRCSKQYEVDPKTLKQYKEGPETCRYHPGKKKSGGRNSERVYNCCNISSTEGCATHVRHVTDCNDYENLPNCVKTLAKENDTNPGVYALDCEMVYTRLGYELARITVVNLKKEVIYDTLVKPKYPIECYNTVYSGIEEKMMEGVKTTLKDVQAVLLSLFSNKTIIIGHSLDSDLRALHLIHETVVDTSVVYKNEKYFPYKYSLKDLCIKKISKIIQDNVGGHDSAEDAIAALEIMLQHVKEEVSKYETLESYEADRAR